MKALDAADVEGFLRIMKRPVSFWEIKLAFDGKIGVRTLYKQVLSGVNHNRISVKKVAFEKAHVKFFFINGPDTKKSVVKAATETESVGFK